MASKSSGEDSDTDDTEKGLPSLQTLSLGNEQDDSFRNSLNLNEELVGNVSKFIAYPAGCKEKLKRGYLMFHACF